MNFSIFNKMDGPGEYCAKLNKSDKGKYSVLSFDTQVSFYLQSKKSNKLVNITKKEMDSQT